MGDRVFFTRSEPSQLWVSDGTPAGTHPLLTDCVGAVCHLSPADIAVWGDEVVYTTPTGDGISRNIIRTDGTASGTTLALNALESNIIDLSNLKVSDEAVFFTGSHILGGLNIWRLDRATSKPRRIHFRAPISGDYQVAEGELLLKVATPPSPAQTRGEDELWAYGADSGVRRQLASFPWPGPNSPLSLKILTPTASRTFFQAFEEGRGWELWTSDGTVAGTRLLVDLGIDISSNPGPLAAVSSRVAFAVQRGEEQAIWITDGTPETTFPLGAGPASTGEFASFQGDLIYSGRYFSDVANADFGLWRSTGISGNAFLLHGGLGVAQGFTQLEDRLIFSAESIDGEELWATDGTALGTVMIRDIAPGLIPVPILAVCPSSSSPRELTRLGSEVFFTAGYDGGDVELWKSDGTEAGTVLVADICPDYCSSEPADLLSWNAYLGSGPPHCCRAQGLLRRHQPGDRTGAVAHGRHQGRYRSGRRPPPGPTWLLSGLVDRHRRISPVRRRRWSFRSRDLDDRWHRVRDSSPDRSATGGGIVEPE